MPKISTNQRGGVIRYDQEDWLAGLMPNYSATNDNVTSGLKGYLDQVSVDPFRKVGGLNPGPNPSVATNNSVITTAIVNGVAYNDIAYLVGGALLHEFTPATNVVTNAGSFPHTISAHGGHATVVSTDICRANFGGTEYIFYSWNDNTDGDIGRLTPASTFDDDFMSTVPTAAAALSINPHPMNASRGELFIGNGSKISSYDGTTFTDTRLNLQNGFVAQAIIATQNYLVIFASKNTTSLSSYRSESKAFFWDYASSTYTFDYPIDGNLVTAAFIYKGLPACFTAGRSVLNNEAKSNKIQIFTGNEFSTVVAFKETAPGIGGVEVVGDIIRWNSAGTVMQYGSPFDDTKPLNKVAKAGGTSNGMLKNFYDSNFYCSSGTTSTGGMESLGGNWATTTIGIFPVVDFPYVENNRIQMNFVKIHWYGRVTGGNSITVTLYVNRGESTIPLVSGKTIVISSDLIQLIRKDTNNKDISRILTDSVQLFVQYSAGASQGVTPPIIRSLEIHFEYVRN